MRKKIPENIVVLLDNPKQQLKDQKTVAFRTKGR